MIAILLSYFLILYISLGIGVILNKWVVLNNYNILFAILIGFFFQIITSTFYGLFFPLNYYFFLINLAISTLFIIYHFSLVKKIIRNTINSFYRFSICWCPSFRLSVYWFPFISFQFIGFHLFDLIFCGQS